MYQHVTASCDDEMSRCVFFSSLGWQDEFNRFLQEAGCWVAGLLNSTARYTEEVNTCCLRCLENTLKMEYVSIPEGFKFWFKLFDSLLACF